MLMKQNLIYGTYYHCCCMVLSVDFTRPARLSFQPFVAKSFLSPMHNNIWYQVLDERMMLRPMSQPLGVGRSAELTELDDNKLKRARCKCEAVKPDKGTARLSSPVHWGNSISLQTKLSTLLNCQKRGIDRAGSSLGHSSSFNIANHSYLGTFMVACCSTRNQAIWSSLQPHRDS